MELSRDEIGENYKKRREYSEKAFKNQILKSKAFLC